MTESTLSRSSAVVPKRRTFSVVKLLENYALLILTALVFVFFSVNPASSGAFPRGVESPHYIELPSMDLVGLALATVSEATHAGQARVVASVHPGISMGGAVRAEHARDSEGLRFDAVDVTGIPECGNLDVLCVVAEHASYVLLGRNEGNLVRAVHAADPLLVDLVLQKLSEATELRLVD